MTGVGAVGQLRPAPEGLRRFDPGRDLTEVISLLKLGFGSDLDPRDQRWLSEMESLAGAGPLFGWLMRLVPAPQSIFGGYVWVQDGRVVANASLMRATRQVWVIANVVTDPAYRRRGLARRLVVAALDSARAHGARQVQLQVRSDNEVARDLYRALGFHHLTSTTAYRLPSASAARLPLGATPAWRRLPWAADAAARVEPVLARAGELEGPPAGVVRQSLARHGFRGALGDYLKGQRRFTVAAEVAGTYVGVGAACAGRLEGPHSLELITDPRWRGQVEADLLAGLLGALAGFPPFEVDAEAREDETGAQAALETAGFTAVRRLERMALPL